MTGLRRSPLAYLPRKGPLQSAGPLAASLYLGGFLVAGLLSPEPLVALAAALLRLTQPGWIDDGVSLGIDLSLWAAAVVTVWTGIEYGLAARKALKG